MTPSFAFVRVIQAMPAEDLEVLRQAFRASLPVDYLYLDAVEAEHRQRAVAETAVAPL